jgi:hypothetical protein
MEEKKSGLWKNAMNWGLILGIALIIYSLLMFFLDLSLEKWVSWVSYLVIIGGIIVATKSYRDNVLGGTISYGQALGFGTLIVMFASIIGAIYFYVFVTVIDTEFIGKMLLMAEDQLMKQGLPDEQIEMAVEMQKKFMTPMIMSLVSIPSTTFMGFIISLITSIFLKKKSEEIPFE